MAEAELHGFLVVDKPVGLSSFDVIRRVRRILGVRRIGHCGTLDPLASGVLPLAIGQATRLVQFVMDGEKSYRATLCLGVSTTTQDADGEVVARASLDGLDAERVGAALGRFVGDIEQLPPMYSALKRDGVPLYKLARKGVEVERAVRRITIHAIRVLEIALPEVIIEVDCSKGTYIRTLAHDLGEMLGCGAHITALRRLRTGAFPIDNAVTLDALQECGAAALLPCDSALHGYPALEINERAARRLANGIPPLLEEIAHPVDLADGAQVMLRHAGVLLAMARHAPLRQHEERGDFELICVFHGRDTAPL